jgi:hypothetical protein
MATNKKRIAAYLLFFSILTGFLAFFTAYKQASGIHDYSWTYPVAAANVFLCLTMIGSLVMFILLVIGFFLALNVSRVQRKHGLLITYSVILAALITWIVWALNRLF